jgi:translation initiation factor 3 subunit C
MSKFFAKKEAPSSSSSSGSDDSSSEEETQVQQTTQQAKQKKFYGGDSDDSESDGERVVKSTSAKRIEALLQIFDKMKNHVKIADFNSLQEDFENIIREFQLCIGMVFATDKFQTLPGWVLKNLMVLEDSINDVSGAEKKKMNKLNSQAYNKLKQRLKKYLTENGDEENRFSVQLEKYRQNPTNDEDPKQGESPVKEKKKAESSSEESSDDDSSSDGSSSSEDSSSGSDESGAKKKKAKEPKKETKAEGSSSEEESGSDSESESSSGSSEESSEEDEASESGSESDQEDATVLTDG